MTEGALEKVEREVTSTISRVETRREKPVRPKRSAAERERTAASAARRRCWKARVLVRDLLSVVGVPSAALQLWPRPEGADAVHAFDESGGLLFVVPPQGGEVKGYVLTWPCGWGGAEREEPRGGGGCVAPGDAMVGTRPRARGGAGGAWAGRTGLRGPRARSGAGRDRGADPRLRAPQGRCTACRWSVDVGEGSVARMGPAGCLLATRGRCSSGAASAVTPSGARAASRGRGAGGDPDFAAPLLRPPGRGARWSRSGARSARTGSRVLGPDATVGAALRSAVLPSGDAPRRGRDRGLSDTRSRRGGQADVARRLRTLARPALRLASWSSSAPARRRGASPEGRGLRDAFGFPARPPSSGPSGAWMTRARRTCSRISTSGRGKLCALPQACRELRKKHPEPDFWAPFVYILGDAPWMASSSSSSPSSTSGRPRGCGPRARPHRRRGPRRDRAPRGRPDHACEGRSPRWTCPLIRPPLRPDGPRRSSGSAGSDGFVTRRVVRRPSPPRDSSSSSSWSRAHSPRSSATASASRWRRSSASAAGPACPSSSASRARATSAPRRRSSARRTCSSGRSSTFAGYLAEAFVPSLLGLVAWGDRLSRRKWSARVSHRRGRRAAAATVGRRQGARGARRARRRVPLRAVAARGPGARGRRDHAPLAPHGVAEVGLVHRHILLFVGLFVVKCSSARGWPARGSRG